MSGADEAVQPTPQANALPFVAGPDVRLLVLGTMPGAESLRLQQYYANPRNQFWKILFQAFGRDVPERYDDRTAFLTEHGVGLWDVLEVCAREGSLDAGIVPGSERPNDVVGFLRDHPKVRTVALNGGKSFSLFQRLIVPKLGAVGSTIQIVRMPSTSGAHTVSFATKLSQWKSIFEAAV